MMVPNARCRHPLQELTVDSFVPNNTLLVGGKGDDTPTDLSRGGEVLSSSHKSSTQEPSQEASMLLITGPNYSGKSVYLKQASSLISQLSAPKLISRVKR